MNNEELIKKSEEIRKKTLDYRRKTKSSHIGSDLSSVEILTVLYYRLMNPQDTFILSKGHAAGVFYTILNDLKKIPDKEYLKLEGHPTLSLKYGISATTGSLGHGLSIGLGMAIADSKNKIYVLMGDGECDEGQVWEAARTASELKVNNLTSIVDCNGWQGLKNTYHQLLDERFMAFGCNVIRCNGHDCKELIDSLTNKINPNKLNIILATTLKAKGLPDLEDTLRSHYTCIQ
ncbi:MAG: 1-deoxy-D-xylulose-5-phosphate synthase N-terminal domain-containing protein [Nanoarchaeota archaeon]|nr:1-deoxy-D-xylulose-5-phosphate synthase N-terminal domain-containing protein [Nanoarchaeota archaeon]